MFQHDTYGAVTNPSPKAASASSGSANSLQHSAASQQDAVDSNAQDTVNTEKIGEAYKAEENFGLRIFDKSSINRFFREQVVDYLFKDAHTGMTASFMS